MSAPPDHGERSLATFPLDALSRHRLGERVQALLAGARDLVRAQKGPAVLTTGDLLAAFLERGHEGGDAVEDWLVETLGSSVMGQWRTQVRPFRYPLLGIELNRSVGRGSALVEGVVDRAASIAHLVSPAETIGRKVLFGALLLSTEPSNDAHRMLQELGVDAANLREQMLLAVSSWKSSNDPEAWRQVLTLGAQSSALGSSAASPPREVPRWRPAIDDLPLLVARLALYDPRAVNALASLDTAILAEVLRKAGVVTQEDAQRFDADLAKRYLSFQPDPLWMAWMRTVRREDLKRLAREIEQLPFGQRRQPS